MGEGERSGDNRSLCPVLPFFASPFLFQIIRISFMIASFGISAMNRTVSREVREKFIGDLYEILTLLLTSAHLTCIETSFKLSVVVHSIPTI